MTPYDYQEIISVSALKILRKNGLVYLAMEERTGKTLVSILIAEKSKAKKILVLTKKKALDGWNDTLVKFIHEKDYTVTNYHQANKIIDIFDLVILDEAHNYLSAFPKRNKIWKDVKKLTKKVPIIYMSATPFAQGYQLLYNQFALSYWSPWKKYINGYKWFAEYGISNMIRTPYGLKETYSKAKEIAYNEVKHLFISYTRNELGFEHEPEDILHYSELDEDTKLKYNRAINDSVLPIDVDDGEGVIFLDSSMKLRTALHMLEGGVAKDENVYLTLPNHEKIDAIKRDFGDTESLVIMYQYIAEGIKLRREFKKATIYQGTSYAEGIDLSKYKNLVIYSQDFSTARHSQRRARQANKNRDSEIKVHFYLVKGAVSEQVYNTVSKNKQNFIDSVFERELL